MSARVGARVGARERGWGEGEGESDEVRSGYKVRAPAVFYGGVCKVAAPR